MPVRIYAESACDPASRELGLMRRRAIGKNSGMIFVFERPMKLSFWMKDTEIPLDIAYIRDDMTVSEIHSMVPYSTSGIRSSEPVRYALEANAGFFARNGIIPGSRILTAQELPEVAQEPPPPASPDAKTPDQKPAVGAPEKKEQPGGVRPDLVLNRSIAEIVPIANQFKLAIAFDYEYPEGHVKSYFMLPIDRYEIKQGTSGPLLLGRCSHSFGEYRQFIIDHIVGYDIYETRGPNAGRRVAPPPPPPMGKQPSSASDLKPMSHSRENLVKESEYSVGQLMMTEYWDEISRKRDEGKSEGEAILEYLHENSKKNSPRKSGKKSADK